MKLLPYIFICLLALSAASGVMAGDNNSAVDPAAELQDAALNYESAAQAYLTLANELLLARREAPDEEKPDDQRSRRVRNAGLELQAAEQLMHAAGNFDHATRTWLAAAQATRDTDSHEYFRRAGREGRQRATAIMRRAAGLAEHAALEYAATHDLRNQGRASHRAGRIREQLAERR